MMLILSINAPVVSIEMWTVVMAGFVNELGFP